MKKKAKKIQIHEILGQGQANAIPMREVSAFFGISDTDTKKLVQDERRAGYPIVSCRNGYYLGDDQEVREFARHLYAEGLSKIDISSCMIAGQVGAENGEKKTSIP